MQMQWGGNSVEALHGCHINGLIKSSIDQDDEHIMLWPMTRLYSRFSGCDTVGCSANGEQHPFQQ